MPKGPEYELQSQIAQLAHMLGWETLSIRHAFSPARKVYVTALSGSMAKGWPDMILIRARDRRLIFAELKSNVGKLRPDQERVLDVLNDLTLDGMIEKGVMFDPKTYLPVKIEVRVWRPRDFEQIQEVLR